MITAFDSDQIVAIHAKFEKAMELMANMLPYYFLHYGLYESRIDLALEPDEKLRSFDFRRALYNEVPQSKKRYITLSYASLVGKIILLNMYLINLAFICSGDCGVYVIKHLECLLARLPLTEIVDENMTFFREKLCVDLYFNHLEP